MSHNLLYYWLLHIYLFLIALGFAFLVFRGSCTGVFLRGFWRVAVGLAFRGPGIGVGSLWPGLF